MKTIDEEKAVFEKGKWVGLTGFCNNNCLFCFNEDRRKTTSRIKQEKCGGCKYYNKWEGTVKTMQIISVETLIKAGSSYEINNTRKINVCF